MMPCPWALTAAKFQQDHPSADLGVHATLTSEWEFYRWRPLSQPPPASGLVDQHGFFHRRSQSVQDQASPESVAVELEAQIRLALTAGMQPTHMDTHMGTVAHPKFMQIYTNLAVKYRIPAMIFRMDEAGYRATGMSADAAQQAAFYVQLLEQSGLPLLDHIVSLPLNNPVERLEQARSAMSALKPGITHFIIHPSKDTPEIRSITPDWPSRVADYHAFLDERLRQHIKEIGILVIGYRDIQALMPG